MDNQTPAPPRRHVRCFGVGDGWATERRNHSSFLYRLDGAAILIDCGEPLSTSYKAAGLDPNLIDRIFISHFHGDHIGGFLMFMQGMWLAKREKDLHVHMPEEGIGPIRELLRIACLFDELFRFNLHFHPIRSGETATTGKVRVTTHATSHLGSLKTSFQEKYPTNRFEAFCFLIETPDYALGHSSDLGAPEDLEPLVAGPLELLVCELAHFKPDDAFKYLQGRDINRLRFIHLSDPAWEQRDQLLDRAFKSLPDADIAFPDDQTVIALP